MPRPAGAADRTAAGRRGRASAAAPAFCRSGRCSGQPGYVVVNANVSLTDPSERWRLSVGVSNLTDKRYIVGGFSDLPASGFTDATYARPREWSATLRYSFSGDVMYFVITTRTGSDPTGARAAAPTAHRAYPVRHSHQIP